MRQTLQVALKTLVVLVVILATGPLVGAGARAGLLEIAMIPSALLMIAIFRALGARAEHLAWAAFLVVVGSVYLGPGIAEPSPLREWTAFAVFVGFAAASLAVSPWALAAGFASHIAWDFLPRQLTPEFASLPVACLIFDGAVAAYIAWQAHSGRWTTLRRAATA